MSLESVSRRLALVDQDGTKIVRSDALACSLRTPLLQHQKPLPQPTPKSAQVARLPPSSCRSYLRFSSCD